MKKFNCKNIEDLDQVVAFLQTLNANIFLLYGELGAGKTTLVQSFCKILGARDDVNSPSYGLINEYECENRKVYHMDLYRLKSLEEALDIGVEEYLYADAYNFIEWPQVIEGILDQDCVRIDITTDDNLERDIIVRAFN